MDAIRLAECTGPGLIKTPGSLQRQWYNFCMDKSIHRYSSLDAMKADEYRYWQSVSGQERMRAVSEMSAEAYALKGQLPDVLRLQRTLVRIQRSPG